MADYQIDVNVDVHDEQLDEAERKIKSLESNPVNVKIKTEFINGKDLTKSLKKDVQEAIKSAQRSAKSSGTSLTQGLLDTDDLDKFAKNIKAISKSVGKDLDLGTIKLTVNDSIMTELDSVQTKLNSIKETAKSMGSIKLKIADNLDLTNGEITIDSASKQIRQTRTPTYNQQIANLKRTVEAEKDLYTRADKGVLNTDQQSRLNDILKQRKDIVKALTDSYGPTGETLAEKAILNAQTSTDKQLKQLNSITDKQVQTLQTNYKKYSNWDSNSSDLFGQSLGKVYSDRLKDYEASVDKITKIKSSMNALDDEARVKASAELETYFNKAKEQEKYLKNYDQFLFKSTGKYSQSKYIGINANSEEIKDNMESMAKSIANGKKYTTEFNAESKKMVATIEQGSGLVEKYSLKYKDGPGTIESSLSHVSQQIKPLSSYISDLGSKFKTLSQYLISNFGFEALQKGVTSGIQSIKDLDTAMTELKKTSEGTHQQYRDFTEQANKDAKAVGSTTTQITNSAATWSRLGYSLSDSSMMAKQTNILKNVSEFESIDDATDSLVGIMQAYHIDPKDSSELIDKLNKIGNNFSISTSGLAEALQISGSMLEVAGNTKEQSMAIVTAMNSSIQDPAQAARAARTVAMRLTGVDSETLQAEGEDIDGLIESVPKLEEKIKSLTAINGKMGVSLTDSVGNFRSTYDILLDIADIWKDIQEADKKDGKNRANDLLETMANLSQYVQKCA